MNDPFATVATWHPSERETLLVALLDRALAALELGPHEQCSCSNCRPLAKERRELRHEISMVLRASAPPTCWRCRAGEPRDAHECEASP